MKIQGKKGQMKIQEMAFVLVAIFIFFSIILIFYINIRVGNLREGVEDISNLEVQENLRKIAYSPEFSMVDCFGCVDLDKVFALKKNNKYSDFWNMDYLQFEIIYPLSKNSECNGQNQECNKITLINKTNEFTTRSAFVPLCYQEYSGSNRIVCKLGKVYGAFEENE